MQSHLIDLSQQTLNPSGNTFFISRSPPVCPCATSSESSSYMSSTESSTSYSTESSSSSRKPKKSAKNCSGDGSVEVPVIRSLCVSSQTIATNRLLVNNVLVIPELFLPPSLTVSTLFGADSGAPLQLATVLNNETPIPQGVYTGTSGFPVLTPGSLPNFFALMSTENPDMINNWQHAVRIFSKIFIRNVSTTDTYRVAYSLYIYSRNELTEQNQLLDLDIHTLRPEETETFTVDWFSGKQLPVGQTSLPTVFNACEKTLPTINNTRSLAIYTAVSLLGTPSNLANLRTFALTTDSVKRNILLYYRTFTNC